jgi:hypothetical protein
MSDHLGVNDIPKAKPLENNDRSTALTVNAAGTSPHICAETVPVIRRTHDLLDSVEAKFPDDQQIAGRVRIVRHQLRLKAGGDESPELQAGITRTLTEIGDLIAARTVSPRMEG